MRYLARVAKGHVEAEVVGVLRRGLGWVIEAEDRDWIIQIVEEHEPGRYVDKRRHWLVGLDGTSRRIAVLDRRSATQRQADKDARRKPRLSMPPERKTGWYIAGAPGTGTRQ